MTLTDKTAFIYVCFRLLTTWCLNLNISCNNITSITVIKGKTSVLTSVSSWTTFCYIKPNILYINSKTGMLRFHRLMNDYICNKKSTIAY